MSADPPHLGNALDSAVQAADGACQATWAIWHTMAPAEQDDWLESARHRWPRSDIFLRVILPAAEAIVHAEREADQ
jgi:hypothetical protein